MGEPTIVPNPNAVARLCGGWELTPSFDHRATGWYLRRPGGERSRHDTWAAAVKASRVTDWVRIVENGGGATWVPAAGVRDDLRWSHGPRGSTPRVRFEAGTAACEVWISRGDHRMSYSGCCGRVAVGTARQFGGDVPACTMHVRAQERRDEADRAMHAEWAARDQRRQRDREAEQAARDLVPVVVGALDALDVARAAEQVGTDGKGGVTLTTDAARILAEVATTWADLREVL